MRTTSPASRLLLRAAIRIREHLVEPPRLHPLPALPAHEWQTAANTLRRLDLVIRRGWRAAIDQLLRDWDYDLRRLRQELDHRQIQGPRKAPVVMPLADILQDLQWLQEEFADFHLQLKEGSLEVLTNSIVLERLNLGPFRIVLRWEQIGHSSPYDVIARSPVASSHDSEVTHPHVRDGQLCEGEGSAAIRAALAQGRLLDFFTLVRQVLETYNPSSAYVSLDRWDGIACDDCGYRMPADDYSNCERCDDPLCSECSVSCGGCSRYVCTGCSACCADCGESHCTSCLDSPPQSSRQLCAACLEEACKEPPSDDDDSPNPADPAGDPDKAVQGSAATPADALCLVEAAVPA